MSALVDAARLMPTPVLPRRRAPLTVSSTAAVVAIPIPPLPLYSPPTILRFGASVVTPLLKQPTLVQLIIWIAGLLAVKYHDPKALFGPNSVATFVNMWSYAPPPKVSQ